MMIDDFQRELKIDLIFNETTLDNKLENLPMVTTKWCDRLVKSKIALNKLIDRRKIIVRVKQDFYTGRKPNKETGKYCPVSLSTQEIRDVYIPSDKEIIDINTKISNAKGLYEFLEHAVKQCNDVKWTIKAYIDWQRYRNGAM